jgi:hypothetical protein
MWHMLSVYNMFLSSLCQQRGQKHIHTQHMSCQQGGQKIFYTPSICHVNKEDKNIIYTLSICHMSTRRTTSYSTHSAYIMSTRRTKTYSTHSAYVTCQRGQKHILHTQHMSHVNKEDNIILWCCPPCWHVTYAECVEYVFVLLVDMWHMLSVYIFYTLSICHVNKEDNIIFYTLSICHMSTTRTKTYTHSAYVTCQQRGQKHNLHTHMFLSSFLTSDICWVCRICFCPPCWHVTYAECVYVFVLVVDMWHMLSVYMFLFSLLTCDICWVILHTHHMSCQQGGQHHILHTQHMSHVNNEDKNISTLSICHMSTTRTKT